MKAFHTSIRAALKNTTLQEALGANAKRRREGRAKAFETLPLPNRVRSEARTIRQASIGSLEANLNIFTERLQAKGVTVHQAHDAVSACEVILKIAATHHARLVAKSKSMVSEEIGLNQALEQGGYQVVETDLGEFIVQLRGEHPSHIITPALHLKREQVAETFSQSLGMTYSTDVADLNQAAHNALRQVFIEADIGVTGVNFGIAESGTLCIVTNEGNGRMVTTLPRVHIGLMGMERVIANLIELGPMLQLLPRSATGQILSSYVSLINGPRQSADLDGPEERHVILIDNHRSTLLDTPYEEALLCIRCGACLNACPVFERLGGHAYASPYPGPIGAVISPGMWGIDVYGHLARASTLCGVCKEVCPVDIDLPGMLLELRRASRQSIAPNISARMLAQTYAWVMKSPRRYNLVRWFAAMVTSLMPKHEGWVRWAPLPLSLWTRTRDLPRFYLPGAESTRYSAKALHSTNPNSDDNPPDNTTNSLHPLRDELVRHWIEEWHKVDGEVLRCAEKELSQHVVGMVRRLGANAVLFSPELDRQWPTLGKGLDAAGVDCVTPRIPPHDIHEDRKACLTALDQIPIGITSASAALADSGSIILQGTEVQSGLASLLPHTHIAILREQAIFADFKEWIQQSEGIGAGTTVIITGPSRTADIEMTLTIGVHGPARVIVVLISEIEDPPN